MENAFKSPPPINAPLAIYGLAESAVPAMDEKLAIGFKILFIALSLGLLSSGFDNL